MNIRKAERKDALSISQLMDQLGYGASTELIESKLHEFSKNSHDEVFVAQKNDVVVGCISCHITSLFHQKGSSGRITSLVIDQNFRGGGIGKLLVQEAENFFHAKGCIKSEVTSGDHRTEAHSFYESCGYKKDERRFIKIYS
ncbi:GNAT family N-acetyltransferase [Leucothrix sargassi]|nr:GNAT family N-acetyltransferase [Leucothrix sargassi]